MDTREYTPAPAPKTADQINPVIVVSVGGKDTLAAPASYIELGTLDKNCYAVVMVTESGLNLYVALDENSVLELAQSLILSVIGE